MRINRAIIPSVFVVVCIGLLFTLFKLTQTSKIYAEWYNSAWGYRQAIQFTNGGSAVTDQKVLVEFATNTPISANKMQSSCQDVRFTDAQGKLLQYYINPSGGAGVGCNDASSDLYVLMPSIVAGSNLIYIYYGNPTALAGTTPANFDATTFSPSSGPTASSEEVSPGPVAYWKFDENQGSTANDATGHGNALTLTSTAWATQSASLSNRTTYLQFNGATSVASRANDTDFDFGTGSFSISAWIRHASSASSTDVLINKYNTQGWKVYMNASGFICFGIDDDSTWGPDDSACTTTSYADSQWHHIEVVKVGATSITVYIDGVQKAQTTSLTATATLSTTATLYIGADSAGNTNWWDGWVDEVAIYPYARTPSQIKLDVLGSSTASGSATLIGAGAYDPLTNGLVGYWKFDEKTGISTTDISGNANTGTLTNSPAWGNGKYGSSINFDGADDYVEMGSASNLDNLFDGGGSFSAWVYLNSYGEGTGGYGRIFDKNSSGTAIYVCGPSSVNCNLNSIQLYLDANVPGRWSAPADSLTTGSWHHVVVTFDSSSLTNDPLIYINGKPVVVTENTTPTSSFWGDSSGNFLLGNNLATDRAFHGYIDDARVYNKILTPSEIRQLYAWTPGPIGWWKMDEAAPNSCAGGSTICATVQAMGTMQQLSGMLSYRRVKLATRCLYKAHRII